MESKEFVAEGRLQLGPMDKHFLFLDGEHIGPRIATQFGVPLEQGDYTDLGYVRITVEQVEEPESS